MANYHRGDQRARAIHALQLRIDGETWESIAGQTDWKTESGVRRAVSALLDKWESETVDEYRIIQDQRYLALLRAWFRPACDGDEKAAVIVLRVMEAINRLHRLNRDDPTDTGGRVSPEEFQAMLAEYVALHTSLPAALTAGTPA